MRDLYAYYVSNMYLNFVTSENKSVAEATCTFPTPLQLKEPHEIAVLSLDLTQSWHNAPTTGVVRVRYRGVEVGRSRFPLQSYSNTKSIAKALNSLMTSLRAREGIVWVGEDETLIVTVKPGYALHLTPSIVQFLKLGRGQINNTDGEQDISVLCEPDVLENFRRIFLMSDDVEKNHYYNNSLVPILCSFPVHQMDPDIDIMSSNFLDPHYFRLKSTNYIEKLTMKFMDELGRPITIDNKKGHCYVLAHLRSAK